MNGHVDSFGRAIVSVSIRPSENAARHEVPVWIDTAFNGDLVYPLLGVGLLVGLDLHISYRSGNITIE